VMMSLMILSDLLDASLRTRVLSWTVSFMTVETSEDVLVGVRNKCRSIVKRVQFAGHGGEKGLPGNIADRWRGS
jgi:hypothetical protein